MFPRFQHVDTDVRVLLWRVHIIDEYCECGVEDVLSSGSSMDERPAGRSQAAHLMQTLFAFYADPNLHDLVPHVLGDAQVDLQHRHFAADSYNIIVKIGVAVSARNGTRTS